MSCLTPCIPVQVSDRKRRVLHPGADDLAEYETADAVKNDPREFDAVEFSNIFPPRLAHSFALFGDLGSFHPGPAALLCAVRNCARLCDTF